jgi:uncharacterized protein
MRPVVMLARLNDIDLTVDSLRTRLAEVASALKEPPALEQARRSLAEGEAELARWRDVQQARELDQKRVVEKLAHARERLYGGKVRDPRELRNAERDVEQLRHQQSQTEDTLLEALIAVEGASEICSERSATLAALISGWETTQAELSAEQARLRERLLSEQARQVAARRAVPADLLTLYDNLRARRGGRAVARLDGDICSACRVAVPPTKLEVARYGNELVYCGNCGRLVWGPD